MHNSLLKIRWPFGCLIFFAISCNNSPRYKALVITRSDSIAHQELISRSYTCIAAVKGQLKNGDLVTRTGNDFTSESLRSLNRRDQTYSHCGIVHIENDSVFVYHALGGEWNPDQKILRQPFEQFADPYSNRGIGLYRFLLSPASLSNFTDTVKNYYDRGIRFDMEFDLSTDDRMYCAEFVAKCFINGSHRQLSFNHSFIGKFEFIGVDDIFLHSSCKKVMQVLYK